MASANIDLADGTKITIVGTPEEIARIIELYGRGPQLPSKNEPVLKAPWRARPGRQPSARGRSGAMQHIRSLNEEGFFHERQTIASVQKKLEEIGHIYPQTHLSTPLRRLVQSKELRRLKEGKNWVYVHAG